jgi:hypothetical protein
MQNLDEILSCKHCKEMASIVTYFLPHKKSRIERERNPEYKRIYLKKA